MPAKTTLCSRCGVAALALHTTRSASAPTAILPCKLAFATSNPLDHCGTHLSWVQTKQFGRVRAAHGHKAHEVETSGRNATFPQKRQSLADDRRADRDAAIGGTSGGRVVRGASGERTTARCHDNSLQSSIDSLGEQLEGVGGMLRATTSRDTSERRVDGARVDGERAGRHVGENDGASLAGGGDSATRVA